MNKLELKADIVLLNGKIITVDPDNRIDEAVAIRGNVIVGVGTSEEIKSLICDETKVIDLKGKVVMPGIIDSHTHPSSLATKYLEVNCRSTTKK